MLPFILQHPAEGRRGLLAVALGFSVLMLMSRASGGSRAALPGDARMKPTRRATTDTSSLVQAKLKPVMPVIHEDNLYVQVP